MRIGVSVGAGHEPEVNSHIAGRLILPMHP
jgi:hypothetical protein